MNNVKLLAHTVPALEEIEGFNLGEFIAYCAKVSNPASQANTITMPKLLKYLREHAHWSPFEMANIVMEITTTRDIARQILRHRSFSFQEYSQRYAEVESNRFLLREARLQDDKNRQNSVELDEKNEDHVKLAEEWAERQVALIKASNQIYQWALDKGIAKEQARAVLPEGNTLSTIIVNGTVRSWMHYCDLRVGNGTQKEHMKIAEECQHIMLGLMAEQVTRVDELNQLNIMMGTPEEEEEDGAN